MAMTDAAARPAPSAGEQVVNGVKILADLALLPGSSQIVQGKVGSGILYGLVGVAAKAAFGPIGWVAAGLDSYSVSASGRHLWELLSVPRPKDTAPTVVQPE